MSTPSMPSWAQIPEGTTVLFHASPPGNRDSITVLGLSVDYDQGEGYTEPGVYLSLAASLSTFDDVWAVDITGVHLLPDDPAQFAEFADLGGSWYSPASIGPDRLTLVKAATRTWQPAIVA